MADERGVTYGIDFTLDSSAFEQTEQRTEDVKNAAQEAADSIEQIGVRVQGVGVKASAALPPVTQSSQRVGVSIRNKVGNSFDRAGVKAQSFGIRARSAFDAVKNAVLHPIQTIKSNLVPALEDVGRQTDDAGRKAYAAGDQFKELGSRGGDAADSLTDKFSRLVKTIAGIAIVKKAIDVIKDFGGAAMGAAATAEETQSKFETVFGGSAAASQIWINKFSSAAKRSKNEIKGFMADAQAMMLGLGMTGDAAASMSQQVTSLSYDLASFHNIQDADAFAKIRSGLMGETEGLKSLGIVMNEAAIQRAMLDAGYQGNESSLRKQFAALAEGEKAQLRFNVISSQSAAALGDVTRTADSYTNSLKGVQGVWQDFLANAGAKFTPVLTGMFNAILKMWPRVEPQLMKFVDVLSSGLETIVPLLMEVGMQLLPVISTMLSTVFTALEPFLPVLADLISTVLPPIAEIIGKIATTLLPPIATVISTIVRLVEPFMPTLMTLVDAILRPMAALLEVISPLLDALTPVVNLLADAFGALASVLETVIGWLGDIVGWLGGAATDVINFLFGGSSQPTATQSYGSIPHNTAGTSNFPGGLTYINEQGGELAILPSGTQIIPADKSAALISRSTRTTSNVFAPVMNVTLSGRATEGDKAELELWFKGMAKSAAKEYFEEQASDAALQEAL